MANFCTVLKKFRISLSWATILWALFIILSASFMRQLLDLLLLILSRETIGILLLILLMASAALVLPSTHKLQSKRRKLLVLVLLGSLLLLAASMSIQEERLHIFKYTLLGYLCRRDMTLILDKNRGWGSLFIAAFGLVVSAADEGFQALLPYRVGDPRDLVFDFFSYLVGALLLTLLLENKVILGRQNV